MRHRTSHKLNVGPYRSLAQIKKGRNVLVHHIQGGHGLSNRLLVLGFTRGARVTVHQNSGFGPVIVLVRDSRIALGRGEANHVLVQEINSE